ncbi:MAG: hypothetical protein R3C12_21640 [Planctomycetaceae bacterium]
MPALKLPMTTILTALMYASLSSGAVMVFHPLMNLKRNPFSYSKSTPTNRVLNSYAIDAGGENTWRRLLSSGTLPDLLKALEVPIESADAGVLKTSLQMRRISPRVLLALFTSMIMSKGDSARPVMCWKSRC